MTRTRTHLPAITWLEAVKRLQTNRSLPLNNTPWDRPIQTEIVISKPRSHTPILRALHLQKNPRTTLAIRVTLENVILHLFARAGGVLFLASKFHDRLVFAVAFFARGVSEMRNA
jgi:tRNA A37 threonylcarbamoyladenosine synthetase subunit TsaC/SUA5/YrdC